MPSAPLDRPISVPRQAALERFANSRRFPEANFDNYFASLIPYSPRIRNSAVGTNDELKLDRARLEVWKRVPVLFLVAEEDRTVPTQLTQETARVMGVPYVMLGRDWGMPGHAHLYIVEQGNEEIARRVEEWVAQAVRKR